MSEESSKTREVVLSVRGLGVQNQTLEEHGSVSEAVVEEMSSGALNLSGADIAVAVSGVAGPGGATCCGRCACRAVACAGRRASPTRARSS